MGLISRPVADRLKAIVLRIYDDNLFLLASSTSYYSALALAPFLLILLGFASLLNQDIKNQIMQHAQLNFSPRVAELLQIILDNVNTDMNLASFSGIVGVLVLLWTCSLVFLQFRYSFDVIYKFHDPKRERPILELVYERLLAMVVVISGAVLLIITFTAFALIEYIFKEFEQKLIAFRTIAFVLNFLIYLALFTGLHYFTPSHRQKIKDAFRIAFLSSIFFLTGNLLLASYLKGVAVASVYGAAGTLLVFLIWSYYSTFTIFLSVELYQYLKKRGRIK